MALRAATGLLMDGDANEVLIDDREPDPPPEAAVAASSNLPPDADDDDVHCASHHRDGPLSRRAADCLVADRRFLGAERLCRRGRLLRLDHRPPGAVRLYLGIDPPHAWRHTPSDLGHRPRLRRA